eukprot:SAG25_NODE_3582_length_1033_cov_3.766595_1_plen_150_part_00
MGLGDCLFFALYVLVCCGGGGGRGGIIGAHGQATPPSSGSCDMGTLYTRIQAMNTACCSAPAHCDGAPPTTCSLDCGIQFVPLYAECSTVINVLLDGTDGTLDGTASFLSTLGDQCRALSPADVLDRIGQLRGSGSCPAHSNSSSSTYT